jgi:hypothetical protein
MNAKLNPRTLRFIPPVSSLSTITVVLVLAFADRAHSATNRVTSLADSSAGSLRRLIADSAPGDSIVFGVTGTVTLASGKLVVDKDLTIMGPGVSSLAISGGGFQVSGGVHFTLLNLTIANGSSDSGAGIYNGGGYLSVQNCLFARNTANGNPASTNGCGGAVFNSGTATITSSTFAANSAVGAAGSDGTGGPGSAGCGGAVYNLGNLELRDSTFLNNSVRGGPGGRGGDGMSSMTIAGPGGGDGPGGDGEGGALFNAGVATVVNSTFTSNNAYGGPGGVGGSGGNSLYTGYPPRYYGGAGGRGGMGGVACGAIYDISGLCFLTNCTVSSNSGFGGTGGPGGPGGSGGLGSGPAGATGSDGQVLGSLRGAGAVLVNTLLSGNAPGGNCSGTITDGGHNLSSDLSCAFTNVGSLNNTDAKLGPLADNGGPTLTTALLPGSPAIDAGDTSLAPTTDQRGGPAAVLADGGHRCVRVLAHLAGQSNGVWRDRHSGLRYQRSNLPAACQQQFLELGAACHQPNRERRNGSILRHLRSWQRLPVLPPGDSISVELKDTHGA